MKHFYILLLAGIAFCGSCSFFESKKEGKNEEYSENRARMEAEAQIRLAKARLQMAQGDFEAAKASIRQMREDCYLALAAREEAIVLMDSADLKIAQQELAQVDSLLLAGVDSIKQEDFDEACRKVQFYERKIQHDKERISGEKKK